MSDEDINLPPPFALTNAQITILKAHVSEYAAGKRESRAKLRRALLKELRALTPSVDKKQLHNVSTA